MERKNNLSTGICTCGNHISSRRLVASIISEYSKSEVDKMLDSDFGKQNTANLNLIYDSLTNAIADNKDSIILKNATGNHQYAINELAVWLSHKWSPGQTIKVKFLNTVPYLEIIVKEVAQEWGKFANIHFDFVENEDADVRIYFGSDNIFWSRIGTLCRHVIDQKDPAMHLGAYNIGHDEQIIRGVFLHEFGHVLGCIHEHQHPDVSIPWVEQKVIEYFRETENWDENKTRHNVLNKLPDEDLSNSEYDPNSIMHYFFPSELTEDKREFKLNTSLSQKDRDFISFCYPF